MTKTACLFFACALAAMAQPNLSGVWESTGDDHSMVRINQQGSTVEVTVRSATGDLSYKEVIGQETKNLFRDVPVLIAAEWDGGTLVTHLRAHVQEGKELQVTGRMTLSADGNALTHAQTRRVGQDPETTQTSTFVRRPATVWLNDPPVVPAESVYKNIQVMKGIPAPRIQEVMSNLTRWLGVECSYCHVPEHANLDEKPAKQTARKMFLMVRALNHDHFPESNAVTCWTCHRGAAKPQSLPAQ
jgi:hypothetical protein